MENQYHFLRSEEESGHYQIRVEELSGNFLHAWSRALRSSSAIGSVIRFLTSKILGVKTTAISLTPTVLITKGFNSFISLTFPGSIMIKSLSLPTLRLSIILHLSGFSMLSHIYELFLSLFQEGRLLFKDA